MKHWYFIVAIFIAGIVGLFIYNQSQSAKLPQSTPNPLTTTTKPTPLPKEVNLKAGFAIFTNGTFRVFTASMYHNLSKDVYIQADNPNVIHVKKASVKWDDFFKTLPLKLTKDCLVTGTKQTFCTGTAGTLKFYLNGVKTDNLLNLEIKDGDRALITYGSEIESQIKQQLTQIPKP